jgi:hypothetical protein
MATGLTLTSHLESVLRNVIADSTNMFTAIEREECSTDLNAGILRIKNIDIIQRYITKIGNLSLTECVKGSNAILIKNEKKQEDSDVKASMERSAYLKLKAEQRIYNKMVFGTEK